MIVQFKEWTCELQVGNYGNGVKALYLTGTGEEAGENIATCTVCLMDRPQPKEGYIYVKEYSENVGMTEALIKANVIENEFVAEEVGPYGSFVTLCKLNMDNVELKKLLKLWE